MSTATNVKPIGAYNNCFRFTVFAEKISGSGLTLAVGESAIFSIVAAIPDKSLTLNLMNIKSPDKNTNTVYYCDGSFCSDTTGEAIVETMDFSITMNQDYNTIINDIAPEVCKDIWRAILTGDKFTDGNGDYFVVVGVNGQRWIDSSKSVTTELRYLLTKDGMLKHPSRKEADGTPYLEANGKVAPFNDRALHMFEVMGSYSDTEMSGYRIAYAMNMGSTFNQDTTANNYSIDEKRLCDVFDIDKYLVEGISDPQALATTGTPTVYRVNCTHILLVSAPGVPTIVGATEGDNALVIDTDDGKISMYKYVSATWTAVTSLLGVGAKIFAPKYATNLDGSTGAVTQNCYVAVKTPGANTVAVAADWNTKGTSGITYTGTKSYIGRIFDWNYTTSKFTAYSGE
jgi:hypothetical protein